MAQIWKVIHYNRNGTSVEIRFFLLGCAYFVVFSKLAQPITYEKRLNNPSEKNVQKTFKTVNLSSKCPKKGGFVGIDTVEMLCKCCAINKC